MTKMRTPLTENEFILKEFAKRIRKETRFVKTVLHKENRKNGLGVGYYTTDPCLELCIDTRRVYVIKLHNKEITINKPRRGTIGGSTPAYRKHSFELGDPNCFDDIIAMLNNAPPS